MSDGDNPLAAALRAGADAHLLTIGSPSRGWCLRITRGTLWRGRFVKWLPDVFLIHNGKRVER